MSIKVINGQSVQFVLEGSIEGDAAGQITTVSEIVNRASHLPSYAPTDEQVKLVAKMDTFVSREKSFISKYPNATLYKVADESQNSFHLCYLYGIENDKADEKVGISMSVGAESKLDIKSKSGTLSLNSEAVV